MHEARPGQRKGGSFARVAYARPAGSVVSSLPECRPRAPAAGTIDIGVSLLDARRDLLDQPITDVAP
jgi:hypothetical protein